MTRKCKKAPSSICIMRLSAIGDVTHMLPTIHTIKQAWPQTSITWIIGSLEYQLLKDIEGIEFILFDKKKGWRAITDLFHQLKGRSFDIFLHMQVSLRASIASLAVKAPIRVGFDRKRARNGQWLFTNYKIAHITNQHVLDSFLEFPKALGIESTCMKWDIPISEVALSSATERFCLPDRYAIINPCSSSRIRNYRNWSVENYAAVADHLFNRYGITTVLTGGPTEMEIDVARAISLKSSTSTINTVGQTSLAELTAIISRASLAIAPDTGPMHLANAAGIPTIGLFATSNPNRTGPYLNIDNCINRYPDAVENEFNKGVDELRWGTRVRDPEAMLLISVDGVCQMIDTILTKQ